MSCAISEGKHQGAEHRLARESTVINSTVTRVLVQNLDKRGLGVEKCQVSNKLVGPQLQLVQERLQ